MEHEQPSRVGRQSHLKNVNSTLKLNQQASIQFNSILYLTINLVLFQVILTFRYCFNLQILIIIISLKCY